MSSAVMMERAGVGVPGVGMPGFGGQTMPTPTVTPVGPNFMMVPRCTFKFEKVSGGCKVVCVCEDKVAAGMVQNLCTMLAGGLCSFGVTFNGVTVCHYNLTFGFCKCEPTDSGVSFHCTSGDPQCLKMIQACCDSLMSFIDAGCTCCVYLNHTPVCCGCNEPSFAKAGKSGR